MKTQGQIDNLNDDEKLKLDNVSIDSKALNTMLNSNIINNMYAETGWTTRNIIILIVVIMVVILVVLQVTGTVDIIGGLTSIAR